MAYQLTDRQQKFIACYAGNATEAAEMAGYSAAERAGVRNMKDVRICQAIEERRAKELTPQIASRQERQKFWTDTMRDTAEDIRNRLKAAELLGKSEADFTENRNVSGAITIESLLEGLPDDED